MGQGEAQGRACDTAPSRSGHSGIHQSSCMQRREMRVIPVHGAIQSDEKRVFQNIFEYESAGVMNVIHNVFDEWAKKAKRRWRNACI